MTSYSESTRLASFQSDTFTPDSLIAGDRKIRAQKMSLASGVVARGAVLGLVLGTVTPAAAAGNTGGSGTIASATLGAGAKAGVYQLICIEPAANAGVFSVEDPDGIIIGRATVAVAFTGAINFTITDATDFVAGDRFTITVALSASGIDVKQSVAAATDGSQVPWGIAATAADATSAAAEIMVYTYGDFAEEALSLGAGITLAAIREPLRARGIHLVNTLPN